MKVAFNSLGCRLNEAELERLGRALVKEGHLIVDDESFADVYIFNTCGVTQDAMRKSRNMARRLGAKNPRLLVLMGCAVNLGETFQDLDCPCLRIRNEEKMRADEIILLAMSQIDSEKILESTAQHKSHTRSFVKIQDGCNNRCTYCAICFARGAERSESYASIIQEITKLEEGGAKEIILTGVQLGAWKEDNLRLTDLLKGILDKTQIPRIRLSSIEPWHLQEEFSQLWQNPRLCPHLHIPIQSGSNKVLRAMARRGDTHSFIDQTIKLRQSIKNLRLTSDLIVGFPTETQEDFEETLSFLKALRLDDCHIFRYSPRPKTRAAELEQIDEETKKYRWHEANNLQTAISKENAMRFIDMDCEILWEHKGRAKENSPFDLWEGYSENYMRVAAHFPRNENMRNKISRVQCYRYEEAKLFAKAL